VSAKYARLSDLSTPIFDNRELTPTADIFYSRDTDRFRILAEYLVTDDEHELERLQFGWQLSEATRLWLGRFHQSASYWNTEHHHGQFLQTTIYRPAIEEFEDTGGALPSHTTGFLLEHQRQIGANAGLQLSVSAGFTGKLMADQIQPLDLLDPDTGHGSSGSFKLAFLPDFLGENQFGITYGHHVLNVESDVQLPAAWSPATDAIGLTTLGIFADWNWDKWQVIAASTRVETTPRGDLGSAASTFVASYAETAYAFNDRLTAYARIERTHGETEYLEIFPLYLLHQTLAGAKWSLGSKHALKFELSSADARNDHFNRLSIEWSAVLP
jgi:hypothetical protein